MSVGSLTCRGVLCPDRTVKPTISEKNIETSEKVSGTTCSPRFSCSAASLKLNECLYVRSYMNSTAFQFIVETFSRHLQRWNLSQTSDKLKTKPKFCSWTAFIVRVHFKDWRGITIVCTFWFYIGKCFLDWPDFCHNLFNLVSEKVYLQTYIYFCLAVIKSRK